MKKRLLINNLINDIAEDSSISKIMLKAQALSFELYCEDFSNWVRNEQRGYKQDAEIPIYRECGCILKADIFVSYQGIITNYPIPTDQIKNEDIRNFLSSVKIGQSLYELEQLAQKEINGEIRLNIPGSLYPHIGKLLTNGFVQKAFRAIPGTTPRTIINIVKSKLLDFLSSLSREIDLDNNLNDKASQEKISELFIRCIII